jgi:pilus assembly protein CpaB
MRPKSLILLALALGCGLVASIGISQVLDGNNRPTAVETAPIYVALRNINVGDPMTESMVALEEWPKDKVPVGSLVKWEELEGRRPRTNIYQGEPILDGKLLAKGQTNDPIQGVPAGMRLKTISVDARRSAAGLLSPGDRVDVQIYVNRSEAYGITAPVTRIFLQNIRVYAVDQTIEKSSDGEDARSVAKTVSLIVTPAQANKITLAENMGEVSLIPRHPDDESVVDDSEQTADDLLNPSQANSRKKEQLASAGNHEDEESGPLAGLRSLMEQAMAASAEAAGAPAPAAPPFEMTIIYPTEVAHIQFEGGRPVNPENPMQTMTATAAANPLLPSQPVPAPAPAPAPAAAPAADSDDAAPATDGETPGDFPIDFQVK